MSQLKADLKLRARMKGLRGGDYYRYVEGTLQKIDDSRKAKRQKVIDEKVEKVLQTNT